MAGETKNTNKVEKISVFEKVAYGGGDLASNLILVLASTFATFFYTDALGLNPAIIGSIMMFSRFADGFTDIIMGFLMDKTKSKHGKARPWLLWLCLPIAIALVLMFAVPNLGDTGKYIYIAITYNLVTTFLYTMINIPYGALTALMSRDQDQRMVITAFRMFMAQVGALVINAGTLPFINAVGGSSNQRSWVIVSIVYAIIALILFYTCFAATKERVVVEANKEEKIGLGKAFKAIMKNNYWLCIVGIWVAMILGASMSGVVGTYYAKYIIGNENLAGIFAAAAGLPVIILMPFLVGFNRKYGKRNVAMYGSMLNIVGQLLILVNPTSATWIIVCSIIKGVGTSTMMSTIFAMVADTIEYGHWKTGIRVEGMLYSSTTFGAKVGGGVGAAVALGILGGAGYNGLEAVQNQAALDAISNLYLYAPIPFLFIVTFLFYMYKLDKIYPQVMEDLAARENGNK